jgi:WD40 repeat protein
VTAVATTLLDGRPIAVTGSHDATVRVWDLTTGTPIGDPLTGHTDVVGAVATIVLDGRPIALTASHDSTLRVWDLLAGLPIGYPLAVNGPVRAAAFDSDKAGRLVLAGDGMACVSIDLEAIR